MIEKIVKVLDDKEKLEELVKQTKTPFSIGKLIGNLQLDKNYRIKYRFGCEIYFTTDSRNKQMYHLLLLAKNKKGSEDITELVSDCVFDDANYRNKRPKVTLENLLKLSKDDIVVSTGCLASYINRLKPQTPDSNIGKIEQELFARSGEIEQVEEIKEDEFVETLDDDELTRILAEHFGESFFIEMQNHETEKQIEYNKRCLELSRKYDIALFAGIDSHAVNQEQVEMRDHYLRAKGIIYEEESGWHLTYDSYTENVERFKKQGVMSNEEIYCAMENTKICLDFEEITYDQTTRKIPTIYPELTQEERNQKYRDLIQEKWLEYKKEVPEERWEEYEREIDFEVETITSTNVSDYFLFNYELIKRSVAKGGIITRSGRGSAPSYLTNFFLGFTNIDRIKADVKMFPTRFLTADRILAGSLPDID